MISGAMCFMIVSYKLHINNNHTCNRPILSPEMSGDKLFPQSHYHFCKFFYQKQIPRKFPCDALQQLLCLPFWNKHSQLQLLEESEMKKMFG